MNPRQKLRGPFRIRPSGLDLVPEAGLPQSDVSRPTVRDHNRPGFYGVFHKREQTVSGRVGNSSHSNLSNPGSIGLCCNDHQGLVPQVPATSTFFNSSHKRFIHLDLARKPIPSRPDHGPPELLQAGPGGLVAAQTQQALQTQGADPMLLVGHPPHRPKPRPKRKVAPMENRCGHDGRLVPAAAAFNQTSLHRPTAGPRTPRTTKSLRPPQLHQILPAIRLGGKTPFEFRQRARIVFHVSYHYILRMVESSG